MRFYSITGADQPSKAGRRRIVAPRQRSVGSLPDRKRRYSATSDGRSNWITQSA